MQEIYSFLESGLLEKYVVGDTSPSETEKVEGYISKYPEVQSKYDQLQNNLETISQLQAVEPSKDLLQSIFYQLDEKPVIQMVTKQSKTVFWYSIVSTAAAVLFAALTTFFYYQNQRLLDENQVVVDEIFDLRSDIKDTNNKLENVMQQFMALNNPETEKYIIKGNQRAKNLKTVAYINPKEKTSMVEIVSLPQLPEEQCYQMWAQMNDKMVSLGILDPEERDLKQIPYAENALGINITIEPKGGNETATLENSVANITLKKD